MRPIPLNDRCWVLASDIVKLMIHSPSGNVHVLTKGGETIIVEPQLGFGVFKLADQLIKRINEALEGR